MGYPVLLYPPDEPEELEDEPELEEDEVEGELDGLVVEEYVVVVVPPEEEFWPVVVTVWVLPVPPLMKMAIGVNQGEL